ncbi:hypothetical protein JXA32_17035 [Candidatus Sumerlaeota bacterium]|nr:hypothetical protein [Candidatus Sumerlaeota bacterium]
MANGSSGLIRFLLTVMFGAVVIWGGSAWATPLEPSMTPDAPTTQSIENSQLNAAPRVWIFMGAPGDEEREAFYRGLLEDYVKALTAYYEIEAQDITVRYDQGQREGWGACDADGLREETARMAELSHDGAPVWAIFLGHCNQSRGRVMYNLPGPDISEKDLAEMLAEVKPAGGLAVILTMTLSGKMIEELAAEGRIFITASNEEEKANETEFARVLAVVLETPSSDLDGDKLLSADEIFLECKRRVEEIYTEGNLFQTEHCLLDGNGDGKATSRPSHRDARGARLMALKRRPVAEVIQTTDEVPIYPDVD